MRKQKHGTAHAGNAGSRFDNLQSRTKHIARRVASTGQLSVGIAALDNHTAKVKRIEHLLAGFLNGHAFFLAKFGQKFSVLFLLGAGSRVDKGGTVNISQAPLFGKAVNFVDIAQNNQVGNTVSQNLVSSLQRTFFSTFGQYNALLVSFGTRNELFNEFHFDLYI